MTSYASLKRVCVGGVTISLLGGVVYLAGCIRVPPRPAAAAPIVPVAQKEQEIKADPQDWTMYGGSPSRNMANTAVKDLPTEWEIGDAKKKDKGKNILWVADLGSKAYGGPTVAGGRVFIGTNNQNPRDKKWNFIDPKTNKLVDLGVVMCFDASKGNFLWQAVFEKLPGGQVVDWPREGICSSPTVEGDKMYYVSNRCELVCADVKTGKADWNLSMIDKLGVFPHNLSDCSPLLVGDDLWLVTSNGVNEDHINVPAPKAPSFIKVAKKDGKVLWQDNAPTAELLKVQPKGGLPQKDFFKKLVNEGKLVQHGQWANPSYGVVNGQPQIVFPGGDGWIRAFDPEGKLIWQFDCNPKDAKYELSGNGTRSDFIATPVVYKDRVYIGVGQDPEHETGVGHLWCIDMTKKGDVSPELVTDATVFPPKTKPNPNSAKVWHYGGPIPPAERKKFGNRQYYFGRTMSTCAIHDDICYASDLNGYLHCLDANKGTPHWTFDTKAQIWSSPYYADGKVYLGTDENTVFVFEHGTKMKKLAENEMDGRVRATPVAAHGILYVMTENKLYAIKK